MTRLLLAAAATVLLAGCHDEMVEPPAIPAVTPSPTASPAEVARVERVGRREWSVPALNGNVKLSRRGTQWCLSAPDIGPGIACAPTLRYGVGIGFDGAYVAVVAPDAAEPPLLTQPDGTTQTLRPAAGGLIALADPPPGGSLTLYDKDGEGLTRAF